MIDKAEMRDEIIKSYVTDAWSDRLTSMFLELANGVASHRIYTHVAQKEDMIQGGLEHLLKIWKKYDINNESYNPYGYFTRSLFREYGKLYAAQIKYSNRFVTGTDDDYFVETIPANLKNK